ncbi:hypothetical protein EMGBS15_06360 [Filimonas sp.]|nr:hypothetical protein EMGBS15_06360 [Filimonas sp.]
MGVPLPAPKRDMSGRAVRSKSFHEAKSDGFFLNCFSASWSGLSAAIPHTLCCSVCVLAYAGFLMIFSEGHGTKVLHETVFACYVNYFSESHSKILAASKVWHP